MAPSLHVVQHEPVTPGLALSTNPCSLQAIPNLLQNLEDSCKEPWPGTSTRPHRDKGLESWELAGRSQTIHSRKKLRSSLGVCSWHPWVLLATPLKPSMGPRVAFAPWGRLEPLSHFPVHRVLQWGDGARSGPHSSTSRKQPAQLQVPARTHR